MSYYRVPVHWQMSGTLTINAETAEEAAQKARSANRLPDGHYVSGSVTVDDKADNITELRTSEVPETSQKMAAQIVLISRAENDVSEERFFMSDVPENASPGWFENELRERLAEYLASKEGWESIVRYDQDFTWAAFYRIASSIEGITWEKPSKAIIVPGDAIVVDRDELLAPDEMSVDIGVEFDPRTNWPDMIIPGYVNFQTGDVCFDDDVPSIVENTDSLLSAEVILYNGERISVNLAEMQLSKE